MVWTGASPSRAPWRWRWWCHSHDAPYSIGSISGSVSSRTRWDGAYNRPPLSKADITNTPMSRSRASRTLPRFPSNVASMPSPLAVYDPMKW